MCVLLWIKPKSVLAHSAGTVTCPLYRRPRARCDRDGNVEKLSANVQNIVSGVMPGGTPNGWSGKGTPSGSASGYDGSSLGLKAGSSGSSGFLGRPEPASVFIFHISSSRGNAAPSRGRPDAADLGFAALKNIKAALGKPGFLPAPPKTTDRRGNAGGSYT
jgi:hypothetical protein